MAASDKKKLALEVGKRLDALYPETHTFLNFEEDWQLLIAVILSAQATDTSVNQATRVLFAEYPTLKELSEAKKEDILPIIRPVGLGNSKADYILKTAKILLEEYGGEIPRDRKALENLPGVGFKTSGVVLAELYDYPYLPVDTHVYRVSHRLALVSSRIDTPDKTEKRLEELFKDSPHLIHRHRQLILLGRNLCTAQHPKCSSCPMLSICAYGTKVMKAEEKKVKKTKIIVK